MTVVSPPDTEVLFVDDALAEVRRLVDDHGARRVLVVATDNTMARTGLASALRTVQVHRFSEFTANPRMDDVLVGVRLAARVRPDMIVGVGGGSAMDTAKMVRSLPSRRMDALATLRGQAVTVPPHAGVPLVVVPTTAGTGSEVTQFATVYCEGVKLSLDRPEARPDVAVVDPGLTASCPEPLTAACALDALAHALESLWSLRSSAESRELALRAGQGLARVIGTGLSGVDGGTRTELCRLALQAGLAINRTRTTAGHAFAYPLTVRFGIPHGLACALSLSWLLPLAARHRSAWCRDPRGLGFLERRLSEMAGMLGVPVGEDCGAALRRLIASVGFLPDLAGYGVTAGAVEAIVRDALASQRSGNSPVALEREAVVAALRAAL